MPFIRLSHPDVRSHKFNCFSRRLRRAKSAEPNERVNRRLVGSLPPPPSKAHSILRRARGAAVIVRRSLFHFERARSHCFAFFFPFLFSSHYVLCAAKRIISRLIRTPTGADVKRLTKRFAMRCAVSVLRRSRLAAFECGEVRRFTRSTHSFFLLAHLPCLALFDVFYDFLCAIMLGLGLSLEQRISFFCFSLVPSELPLCGVHARRCAGKKEMRFSVSRRALRFPSSRMSRKGAHQPLNRRQGSSLMLNCN